MEGEAPVGDGEDGVVGGPLGGRGVAEEQEGPAGGEEPLGGWVQSLGGREGVQEEDGGGGRERRGGGSDQ